MEKTQRVTVSLPERLFRRLAAEAAADCSRVPDLIRRTVARQFPAEAIKREARNDPR